MLKDLELIILIIKKKKQILRRIEDILEMPKEGSSRSNWEIRRSVGRAVTEILKQKKTPKCSQTWNLCIFWMLR